MAALTAARIVPQAGPDQVLPVNSSAPIADNVKIYPGAMIALSGGYAQPVTAATGLVVVGIYWGGDVLDNTVAGHAAGAFNVPIQSGVFRYNIGDSGSITAANRGMACYAVDDNTVALTDANGTRSVAGVIYDVDASGAWVIQNSADAATTPASSPQFSISIPVPAMSAIANAGVLARFTPGFAGRIKSIQFQVTTAVTTAAKLATLTPAIAGTNVTGGACALTSANCTPIGANVAGSAITALNTFTSAQEITVVASSVTAFVEGAGAIVLNFG